METGENNYLQVVGKKLLGEESFAIIPKNFDEDIALQCLLILEVSETSISFSLVHKNHANHIGLGLYKFDLASSLAENLNFFYHKTSWLKYQFANVIAIERNRVHTLLPEVFYDASIHFDYLKNNSFLIEDGVKHKYVVKSEGAANLSVFTPKIYNTIKNWFAEVNFLHHHDVLLEMSVSWQRLNRQDEIVLNLNDHFFDLVIFNHQKLKFCNSYYFEEPEDVLYYTLLVLESHNFIPAEVSIKIIGQMANNKQYLNLLKLYLPKAEPFSQLKFIEKDEALNAVPNYLFGTLQNGFLCV